VQITKRIFLDAVSGINGIRKRSWNGAIWNDEAVDMISPDMTVYTWYNDAKNQTVQSPLQVLISEHIECVFH